MCVSVYVHVHSCRPLYCRCVCVVRASFVYLYPGICACTVSLCVLVCEIVCVCMSLSVCACSRMCEILYVCEGERWCVCTCAGELLGRRGQQQFPLHVIGASTAGDARLLVPTLHPVRQPLHVTVTVQGVGTQRPDRTHTQTHTKRRARSVTRCGENVHCRLICECACD